MENIDSYDDSIPPIKPNGIFIKLSCLAFFISISSVFCFWLSFQDGYYRYGNMKGVPSDEAVVCSLFLGFVVSQVFTLFLPEGSLFSLFSLHFVKVVFKSIYIWGPAWLLFAYGGSELVKIIFSDFLEKPLWEEEWIQIALVLFSSSITLFTWHIWYHRSPRLVDAELTTIDVEENE